MKKKKCLLGLFVPSLLLAVAGCAREEVGGKGETPANKISLTATFENVQDEGSTKVDISTSGAFTWTEGDQIAVHTSTPNWQTATLESGSGLASGVFTAQMDETDRNGYAIYPASVAGGSADAPTITLPSEYTIDGSMGEYSPLPMIAVNAPSTALAFKHVGGIFRITLDKVPQYTKSIVVTMDKQITGTLTVNVSDASKPTITTTGAASSNTVTFNFSTAFAAETDDVVLNVPVPVGLYTSLSVEAYNDVDGGGTQLSGASGDNVRSISRASGRKVALEIVAYAKRIGSFSLENLWVFVGHSKTMNFTATALDGTTPVTPENMTFSYSPSGIATAAYSAGTLTITGAAIGTTTLTVTAIKGTDQITKTATITCYEATLAKLKELINSGEDCSSCLGWEVNSAGDIAASGVSGTKIGYIGYISTSDVDTGVSGSRILVLASSDASTGAAWGSFYTSRGLDTDGLTGYSYTNTLQGYGQSAHPAAYAAWNYSASIPSGGSTPAHWFMPTKMQLSNIISALGGYSEFTTKVGWSSGNYLSSTEKSASYVYYLNGNGNWFYTFESGGTKNKSWYVRACFAY